MERGGVVAELGGTGPDAGLIAPAVAETIRALPPHAADTAARRLAERYAGQIDEARRLADLVAVFESADEDQARRLHALGKAVEAQTVLGELGPKLLAVLTELGATPRARATARGGGPRDRAGTSKLDELRARRARQHDPAPVDPAAS